MSVATVAVKCKFYSTNGIKIYYQHHVVSQIALSDNLTNLKKIDDIWYILLAHKFNENWYILKAHKFNDIWYNLIQHNHPRCFP